MNIDNQIIDYLDCTKAIKDEIFISNSIIDTLDFSFTSYDYYISIKNCQITNLKIHSSWFKHGFSLEGSIIQKEIKYEMGGHNDLPIELNGNIFCELVVFFDCHFFDKLVLKNNIFYQGTTVMGRLLLNTFQSGVMLKNNVGNLNVNHF